MPPRQEHELDPVTLHNQALVVLAMPAAAPSTQSATQKQAGVAKLLHLLAHPPFPPELAGNLLSLCCRPNEDFGSGAPGGGALGTAHERAEVAQEVLSAHSALVAATVPPAVLPLYEACLARMQHGPAEAAARLDELAGSHIEGLRKRVKAVQDARWAGDHAAAAAGLEAYEAELEVYMPGRSGGLAVCLAWLLCIQGAERFFCRPGCLPTSSPPVPHQGGCAVECVHAPPPGPSARRAHPASVSILNRRHKPTATYGLAVLMSLAHLHWEAGAFGRAQAVLQQSAEFCSDHLVRRRLLPVAAPPPAPSALGPAPATVF